MSVNTFIIKQCFALEDSASYRRVKGFFFKLLIDPQSKIRPYFDIFMIFLVLASVFVLIYEVKTDLGTFGRVFEAFAVGVFLLEYLLRLWLYNDSHKIIIEHYESTEFINGSFRLGPALREIVRKKWDYMTTPLAIIDLLAIIPSYRPLRFLRIFLLFRLFKLFRYARSLNEFSQVLKEKRFELFSLFIFLAFVIFISASAIYFFEARNEGGQIDHFFDGIYWALVTISTVGYGDITPQTVEGRVITLVLIICGIGVVSFFTSIIVSSFGEKMADMRENRIFAELEKSGKHITIICGYGRMGQVVADQLRADRDHFVIIDSDPENIGLAQSKGYLAILGSAENTQLLQDLGIGNRTCRVLCLTDDDVANVFITLTARHMNPDIEIISRANREEIASKLLQVGANHTVMPFRALGLMAGEYIGRPVAFEAIHGMLYGAQKVSLETVMVSSGSILDGVSIGEIDFRAYKMILFGVITSEERAAGKGESVYGMKSRRLFFNPQRDFRIEGGEIIMVFGHELSIVHFKECLERGRIDLVRSS
jgi:voltage-gated potassium channel